MLSAAERLEEALKLYTVYKSGEVAFEGDTVQAGGDEFRVDSVDYQKGIVKGAIDPVGYAASTCVLVKRG